MSILQDGTAVTTLTQAIGTTTLLKLSRVTVGAVAVYAEPAGFARDSVGVPEGDEGKRGVALGRI